MTAAVTYPEAFTVSTLASALRDLEQVRDALRERAGKRNDPHGELVPVLGRTCLAIQAIENSIQQLTKENPR